MKWRISSSVCALVVSFSLLLSSISPVPLFAEANNLVLLTGIEVTNSNAVNFLWRAKKRISSEDLKKAISLYYTALAIPVKNWWVDLFLWNTDEEVLGNGLEKTELGKILVESDLQLKKEVQKVLSSEVGDRFWQKVEEMGLSVVSPRFWIEPGQVKGLRDKDTFKIFDAKLKLCVAIEDSRVSNFQKKELEDILRRDVVPVVERAINTSGAFAPLRSAYYAILLAAWTKRCAGFKSRKLAKIVDSYVLPDIGQAAVGTYTYLVRFAQQMFVQMQTAPGIMAMCGGGGEYKRAVEEVEDVPEQQDLELEDVKDEEEIAEADIPQMNEDVVEGREEENLSNKAAKYGLNLNYQFIYGDVEFDGVDPKEVVGPNVVIVNLSKEKLVINEELVNQYKDVTKWYDGKLFSLVIVKREDGKIEKKFIADIKDDTDGVKYIDTAGKIKALVDNGVIEGKAEIFFVQRPGEKFSEELLDRLKKIGVDIDTINVNVDASSTDVRQYGARHKVLSPILVALRLYSGWTKDVENKGWIELQKGYGKKVRELLIDALQGKKGYEEVKTQLEQWLTLGMVNEKNIPYKLDGTAIDYIDRELVKWMVDKKVEIKKKGKDGKERHVSVVLDTEDVNWLFEIREMLFDYMERRFKDAFKRYEDVMEFETSEERVKHGKKNFQSMMIDTMWQFFGDFLSQEEEKLSMDEKRNIGVLEDEVVTNVFNRLKKEWGEYFDLLESIRVASTVDDLLKVKNAVFEKKIYEIRRFYELKESILFLKKGEELFGEIERLIGEEKIQLDTAGLRVAYYPLKGNPWQVGHILTIAGLLASGKVDKVVVTVDNGDPRKPDLASCALRAPLSEMVLKYVFGDLVEFSPLTYEKVENYSLTGEEMVPQIIESLQSGGKRVEEFYYVAGADHAKFMATDKINKDLKGRVDEVKDFVGQLQQKYGVPVKFDTALGLFYEEDEGVASFGGEDVGKKDMAQEDSVIEEKGKVVIPEELKMESIDEALRAVLGDNWQEILREKGIALEDNLDNLSQLPVVLGVIANLLEEKMAELGKMRDDLVRLIKEIRDILGFEPHHKKDETPSKSGGLMLSQIALRM